MIRLTSAVLIALGLMTALVAAAGLRVGEAAGPDGQAPLVEIAGQRGDLLDVLVSFPAQAPGASPRVIEMSFLDGEAVAFALPGRRDRRYRFERRGRRVEMRIEGAASAIVTRLD